MAPRGPSIDRDRLLELLRDGRSYSQIAEELGASYSGVAHAVKRMGLSRTQLDHSDAIPWTVKEEHKRAAPLQYMRELSQMAKGKMISAHRQATAIRWARALVEEGWDVSYDPNEPPSDFCPQGGFHLIPATERVSRVAGLLQAASQKVSQ